MFVFENLDVRPEGLLELLNGHNAYPGVIDRQAGFVIAVVLLSAHVGSVSFLFLFYRYGF